MSAVDFFILYSRLISNGLNYVKGSDFYPDENTQPVSIT